METEPEKSDFIGAEKAWIDPEKCVGCGICMEHCRFKAIQMINGTCQVQEYACEGCGVCEYVCLNDAVEMREDIAGRLDLYQGNTVFSTAELKMGRGNSGKLVAEVKFKLFDAVPETDLAIVDGSPGIGCPVIASISGMDMVLIVTEPTTSGLSDLKRLLNSTEVFQIKTAVCVNKWDVNAEQTAAIEEFCRINHILFAGKIPYDKTAVSAVNAGHSIAYFDCPARDALLEVYQNTVNEL